MRPRSLTRFRHAPPCWFLAAAAWLLATLDRAQASLLQGEALDSVADALSWVVLIVVPTVFIAVFWLVHILPEKIAEKKQHPQTRAIQCLCLLSLVFGGLLWPIAWLWAYSKPVLYKLAYGTDVDESLEPPGGKSGAPEKTQDKGGGARETADRSEPNEASRLRARVAALEKHFKAEGGPF